MKRLFTSYYAISGKRPKAISVSIKAPFFFKGPIDKTLGPSWELLKDYKDGTIDAAGYTERFGQLMKERGITPQSIVNRFSEDTIMLCYEKTGDFCHRHILAVWLNRSGLAEVYELNKDGTPRDNPTSIEELIEMIDVDVAKKS